jgi:hypothetical protein
MPHAMPPLPEQKSFSAAKWGGVHNPNSARYSALMALQILTALAAPFDPL